MAKKSDSAREHNASRKRSLRYNSEQEKPEIPAYLKAVSASEEEAALATTSDEPKITSFTSEENAQSSEDRITIIMGRNSVISILVGTAIMGLCLFAAGFLVSYTFFPREVVEKKKSVSAKPAEEKLESTAEESAPQPNEEGARLAQMAQNLTSQLKEADAPGAAEANEKVNQTVNAKETAANIKEESKNLKEQTQNLAQTVTAPIVEKSNDMIAVSDLSYTVEIGQTDSRTQAENMKKELAKLKIIAFITSSTNEEARLSYTINAGTFKSYTEAKKYLSTLPKPYSLWGKVATTQKEQAQ